MDAKRLKRAAHKAAKHKEDLLKRQRAYADKKAAAGKSPVKKNWGRPTLLSGAQSELNLEERVATALPSASSSPLLSQSLTSTDAGAPKHFVHPMISIDVS